MAQHILHYSLHLLAPGLIAYLFFRDRWKYAWLLMVLTMLVDLDHLLASPIFDPQRCSIGFHFLHSHWAIVVYAFAFFLSPKKSTVQIIATGLLFHMLTDYIDCRWM